MGKILSENPKMVPLGQNYIPKNNTATIHRQNTPTDSDFQFLAECENEKR